MSPTLSGVWGTWGEVCGVESGVTLACIEPPLETMPVTLLAVRGM